MQSLVRYLRKHIPLSQVIDIRAGELNDEWFELHAPIAPNLNDKQTAFGGSLATLCTLSGWCITSYLCKINQLEIDIVILDSQIRYRLPVTADLIAARAYFPTQPTHDAFLQSLRNEGRARLQLEVAVQVEDKIAVQFNAQYYIRVLPLK